MATARSVYYSTGRQPRRAPPPGQRCRFPARPRTHPVQRTATTALSLCVRRAVGRSRKMPREGRNVGLRSLSDTMQRDFQDVVTSLLHYYQCSTKYDVTGTVGSCPKPRGWETTTWRGAGLEDIAVLGKLLVANGVPGGQATRTPTPSLTQTGLTRPRSCSTPGSGYRRRKRTLCNLRAKRPRDQNNDLVPH